ncbi:MAG: glutamate 5-kinase [Clostridia bacterium]|nr:glutamate 5-kinase [Clostridia bacterium]
MGERDKLSEVKRIVVKVGSSTITHGSGKLNLARMEGLVRQLADLHHQGKEVVLVTSGAVGAGMGKLGLKQRPKTIPEKQATAAVGQGILVHMYEKMFAEYGPVVAQVLLTREDMAERRRFLNARNALLTLLDYGVIPIINENDTVAIEEIRVGDNDTLSAMVASLVDADLLILLSDIEGLYTGNPREDKEAKLIPLVEEITPEVEKLAGGAGSNLGTGGMITKIQAARIAMSSGVAMIIANGSREGSIRDAAAGKDIGTLFLPRENRLQSKKRWIAFNSTVMGCLHIDAGAAKALLKNGKSLLPTGITGVEGDFETGNAVSVYGPDGVEIARGIVNYDAEEIARIKGVKTKDIMEVLGYKDYDEVIHRDNLVLNV